MSITDHPLVLLGPRHAYGLDRDTGRLRWTYAAPRGQFVRLFVFEGRALLFGSRAVHCIDTGTGLAIGVVEIDIPPQTILQDRDRIFFGGEHGMMCMTLDGQILWRNNDALQPGEHPSLGLPGNVVQHDRR